MRYPQPTFLTGRQKFTDRSLDSRAERLLRQVARLCSKTPSFLLNSLLKSPSALNNLKIYVPNLFSLKLTMLSKFVPSFIYFYNLFRLLLTQSLDFPSTELWNYFLKKIPIMFITTNLPTKGDTVMFTFQAPTRPFLTVSTHNSFTEQNICKKFSRSGPSRRFNLFILHLSNFPIFRFNFSGEKNGRQIGIIVGQLRQKRVSCAL
jgi:hypothetical protein